MISYVISAVFSLAFGAWMTVHCAAIARRGLRSGRMEGVFGVYARAWKPVRYWIAVGMTGLASPLGVLLFIFGGVAPLLGEV